MSKLSLQALPSSVKTTGSFVENMVNATVDLQG